MQALLYDLIPHAPKMGLYVGDQIPPAKLQHALRDYAPDVRAEDVLALYDATLMGSAKDGALFTADRVVFQNSDLEPTEIVEYRHIVRVTEKRKLISGKKVFIDVNRGRATVSVTMDFSGKPGAAQFVARFLHEAMHRSIDEEWREESTDAPPRTDLRAVQNALLSLRDDGKLTPEDYERLINALTGD